MFVVDSCLEFDVVLLLVVLVLVVEVVVVLVLVVLFDLVVDPVVLVEVGLDSAFTERLLK